MEPITVKFNRSLDLEIPGLGTFRIGDCVILPTQNQANIYIESGYFDLVKVKEKVKEKKRVIKKYKKKGVDKLCH